METFKAYEKTKYGLYLTITPRRRLCFLRPLVDKYTKPLCGRLNPAQKSVTVLHKFVIELKNSQKVTKSSTLTVTHAGFQKLSIRHHAAGT